MIARENRTKDHHNMETGYSVIIAENIKAICESAERLVGCLPARMEGDTIIFNAFGKPCAISTEGIALDGEFVHDARGVIISLYALHATTEPARIEPFKAFREFENTMPYIGAFSTHTEQILLPYVGKIKQKLDVVKSVLNGSNAPVDTGADISFMVNPLPKIFLCYLLYEPDDEFPASVTCLYSNNASAFLPIDALADVGEYTSKAIIELLETSEGQLDTS